MLAPSAQRYFQAGLASSTQRTYSSALRRFHAFCDNYRVFNPFPVTEHLVCCFMAYLADQGLSPQTGKTYLAAIRSTQISLGLPDPREHSSLPILRRVQAGISRARLLRGSPSKLRLPITTQMLGWIRSRLEESSHSERVLLWAVCCTAFFGFFRLGELLLESMSLLPVIASILG